MIKLMHGDCLELMKHIPDGSVDCCVTSPPYYGLRDYGVDGQAGLEPTQEAYIANLVNVFREVKRLLRDDGTLWLNIGDSYARTGGTDRNVSKTASVGSTRNTIVQMSDRTRNAKTIGLKPKDLIGIPWMLAFALRADGWYLRQEIIWHKPNTMPESVKDRCTKAHESIFLLSKQPKYYFDAKAIEEPAKWERWGNQTENKQSQGNDGRLGNKTLSELPIRDMKNKRSVWTVTTKPYKGAHFATFPPDLIEPCILAGSRYGATVLDPFGGSGTTAGVALKYGRKAIICELNADYVHLVKDRIKAISGIELDQQYFNIAKNRIENAQKEVELACTTMNCDEFILTETRF